MTDYSSRGPTYDGRIKPTVIAPSGEPNVVGIISAKNDQGDPPAPTCNIEGGGYGTSFSSPAVAGAALMTRQYFTDGYYPNGSAGGTSITPSGALVKAVIIASTANISAPNIPDYNEGWGRILMDNALYFPGDTRDLMIEDHTPGLQTGDVWTKTVTINSQIEPFVVSLVWSDYPGTVGNGIALVNDLDLTVTDPTGKVYLGNVFSGGHSALGGARDSRNVEEGARFQAPSLGTWTIQVSAYNVPQGPQPFALALNGAFADWPPDVGVAAPTAPIEEPFVRAWPNPMSHRTDIHYSLPAGWHGPVRLTIVDVTGRLVQTVVDKGQTAGDYHATWTGIDQSGQEVPSGVYFLRLDAGPLALRAKLVVRR